MSSEDARQREYRRKYMQPQSVLSQRYGTTVVPQTTSISLLSRFKGDYYRCPRCKYVIPKSEAKVSGYDSEHSLRHIHCNSCGKKIDYAPKGGNLRNVVEGAAFTAAGASLAVLLYPFLSIYAVQLGVFMSMYGTLKILIRPGR